MQGKDLQEVINGSNVSQPEAEEANEMLCELKIKQGKMMFPLKTTIDENVLEYGTHGYNFWRASYY